MMKQFPACIKRCIIDIELPPYRTGNPEYDDLLTDIFSADQAFALYEAINYLTKSVLSRELKKITEVDFINIIKELHKITSYNLLWLTAVGCRAGQYTDEQVIMVCETGRPDLVFKGTVFFSENNFDILQQLYGSVPAKQYQDFCQKFGEKLPQEKERICTVGDSEIVQKFRFNRSMDGQALIRNNDLTQHPGYTYYKKVISFGTVPDEVPQKMFKYAKTLVEKIRENCSPIEIAMHILSMTGIHPYPNGNGRVARLLMNAVLVMLDIHPLDIIGTKKIYYRAIEAYFRGNSDLLRLYLDGRMAQTQFLTEEDLQSFNDDASAQLVGACENGSQLFKRRGCYECVKQENLDQYEVLRKIINGAATMEPAMGLRFLRIKEAVIEKAKEKLRSICLVIDGAFCLAQAEIAIGKKEPEIALYYYLRGAEFYKEQGVEFKKVCWAYHSVAKYCLKKNLFRSAGEWARLALNLHEEKKLQISERILGELREIVNETRFIFEASPLPANDAVESSPVRLRFA